MEGRPQSGDGAMTSEYKPFPGMGVITLVRDDNGKYRTVYGVFSDKTDAKGRYILREATPEERLGIQAKAQIDADGWRKELMIAGVWYYAGAIAEGVIALKPMRRPPVETPPSSPQPAGSAKAPPTSAPLETPAAPPSAKKEGTPTPELKESKVPSAPPDLKPAATTHPTVEVHSTHGATGPQLGTPQGAPLTPIESKILFGAKRPGTNEFVGGHSPDVLNSPNYTMTNRTINPDGTVSVKDFKAMIERKDGTIGFSKSKSPNIHTIAPPSWSNADVLAAGRKAAQAPGVVLRDSNGVVTTSHVTHFKGVEWQVLKENGKITSSFPTGGRPIKPKDPT